MPAETTITLTGAAPLEGHLPILQFGRFLSTLSIVARGSVRMAFQLRSSGPGRPPPWLTRAADIQYVGHEEAASGTALILAVPTLDYTVEEFSQSVKRSGEWSCQDRTWPYVQEGDTALDLVASAVWDVNSQDRDSRRLDEPLLKNIGRFNQCLNGRISSACFDSYRHSDLPVILNAGTAKMARSMASAPIPAPRRARIVGQLDMVSLSDHNFRLVLDDGRLIDGVLDSGNLEETASMLSTRVLVRGRVVYKPSGNPLRIDADDIGPAISESSSWSYLPEPLTRRSRFSAAQRNALRVRQTPSTGIGAIIGQWPGDETDEEIAEALEMLS